VKETQAVAEAGDTLVKILESITNTNTQLIDILMRMEQRQQEHNLALAQAIGENTRILAKGIEDNSRVLAQMLDHIADALKYIAESTSRTEQMTAGVLARMAGGQSPAH
jgi:hypothetical protein